ncbi:MAG: transcription termination factor NusA [Lentisphaerae bacterium GWF2_49_21]|nr:MAG: transcription termination factor NusA [Lentisphaerae bacterium GWF2_49_21]
MNNELLSTLDYIEQERGISREVLIEAIEKAILSASKKSIHPASELDVKIDRTSGQIKAWAKLQAVESKPTCDQILLSVARERYPNAKVGEIVKWEVTPKNFGRIAAQYAKNTIMNQLRKAEKEIVFEEFKDRIGQVVSGVVRRFEAGSIIIDMQKAEGVLSPKDKIPGETYMQGDRINAILKKIDPSGSGPSLLLSRVSDDFIKKLFEREVSEIHDGIVQIKAIAREPGSRTKIAVQSTDAHVDPVGACVGMRGMRVKNITTELGGEKIDIVPFDEDIKVFASKALQPAALKLIEVDEAAKTLNIKVATDQLSLAIGKRGQNVRLTSKLLGWKININAEEVVVETTFEEKLGQTIESLSETLKIDKEIAQKLVSGGFLSVEGLKAVDAADISKIQGLDEDEAKKVLQSLKKLDKPDKKD